MRSPLKKIDTPSGSCYVPTAMPPSAAADRFARIINNLLQAVAEQGGKRIAGPLTMLIWNRLRRMVARFAATAAAVRAGTYGSVLPAAARRKARIH
jgi:hypothetical protein